MAKGGRDERSGRPPGMVVTSITVVDLTPVRRHPLRAQLAAIRVHRGALVGLILAAVLIAGGAIALTGWTTGPSEAQGTPGLPASERAAIARALGHPYPLRCLTIAVFADDPDYATAQIDTSSSCARYRGHIYASLHRIHGTWRSVLDEGQLYIAGDSGATGARAVGYPLGCLSAKTLIHDPTFAHAGFDRGVCAGSGAP